MKVTPDDFIKMNEEFVREGTPMVLIVPKEQIDNDGKTPCTFEPQPPMNFDDEYELIHEENNWKSVVNGKTIVMHPPRCLCERTEHYLTMCLTKYPR